MVFEKAQADGRIPKYVTREQCTRQDLDTLVAMGHELRHSCGENVWIGRLWGRIMASEATVAIVPGIRFDNEVSWVKKGCGILLRVTRYNADGSLFISPDRDPNDPMETVLNRVNPDFEIAVKTGQEKWLEWQGVSFANYMLETYLREAVLDHSTSALDPVSDAAVAWG